MRCQYPTDICRTFPKTYILVTEKTVHVYPEIFLYSQGTKDTVVKKHSDAWMYIV